MEAVRFRCAVVTISDRCASGETKDSSGPEVERLLLSWGWIVDARALLPDEPDLVAAKLIELVDRGCDLIVTTGGTGFGPRDRTPEATSRIADRLAPGLPELARARTGASFPRSYLSRGIAALRGKSLIVNLPGSPRGARDHLQAVAEVLPHALTVLREDPRAGPPSHPESESRSGEDRS
jgi:molybdenum cofactor synthesis domain-containing protein